MCNYKRELEHIHMHFTVIHILYCTYIFNHSELSLALHKLKRLALENGFTIYDVPYDGNCMFGAISHQLQTSV